MKAPMLEMQARFLFFYWQIKMSNLLHVGLILIISKVFTILCLLCLCRNREYRGNFQNKTVISKHLFCQMSAQVRWERRPFWSGQETISYLHIRAMNIIIIKNYCFQNKSVNSPLNWVFRYILFLPKLKGKERLFLEGCKKEDHIAILSLGWHK